MNSEIPDKAFGKPVKGAMKRVFEKLEKEKSSKKQTNQEAQIIRTEIQNPENYIQIPKTSVLIAKKEAYHNNDWEQTHFKLNESGLFMPTVPIFMKHLLNVRKAANGKTKLYNGNNSQLPQSEAKELWDYLSSTDRTQFNNKICWTWLDAKFVKGSGFLDLDTLSDHRMINGNLEAQLQAPLEKCVDEDMYVSLVLNSQGLPKTRQKKQEYSQGKNMYFWKPEENKVAGFVADSGGADLGCGRRPGGRDDRLGVFSCAEGTGFLGETII